ncbi:MAG: Na/Pi cotransporter family protein [Firmicutes bacterium]|nr:Na/Pi cotransporter family protein [Bacillota bacterium]
MRIFLFVINFALGMSIFLLALQMLGDTMSSIFGFRLRAYLTKFTSTKPKSLFTGFVTTSLVQSSSIVNSTMVVLVDSGVLAVPQALGVILGANIGTTLTAQIVALPIEQTAIPLLFLGLFLMYVVKRPALGKAVFSLGALFFGLAYTTRVLTPLLRLSSVQRILLELTGTPWRACAVGAILTGMVQSSGAVTSLVVGLAGGKLLTLSAAVGVALGSNVGTVITTLVASLGRSRASKATAWGDFLFNVAGVLIVLPLFPFFLRLVELLSSDPGRQVAHAHTLFNVITALATLPLLDNLAHLAWSWAGIRPRNKNT